VGYTSYFKQSNFYISKENVSCSENWELHCNLLIRES
jgi:hypothetical protein